MILRSGPVCLPEMHGGLSLSGVSVTLGAREPIPTTQIP